MKTSKIIRILAEAFALGLLIPIVIVLSIDLLKYLMPILAVFVWVGGTYLFWSDNKK